MKQQMSSPATGTSTATCTDETSLKAAYNDNLDLNNMDRLSTDSLDSSWSMPLPSTSKVTPPLKKKTTTLKKNKKKGPILRDPLCPPWTKCTFYLHNLIRQFSVVLSGHAARNPWTYVIFISLLSMTTLALGFFTNFQIQVEYDVIYAPHDSIPTQHMNWIYYEAGFPEGVRPFSLMVHNHGNNVLTNQGVRQMFEVLETLQKTPGYAELCAQSKYVMHYPNETEVEDACHIVGSTRFWYYQKALFEAQKPADREVMRILSNSTYPDGVPVDHDFILGKYQWTNQTQVYQPVLQHTITWETEPTITFAKSLMDTILLPDVDHALEFEYAAMENLLQLQKKWREAIVFEESKGLTYRTYQLEFFTMESYSAEFERAIFKDMPLTFMVAVIMVGFTCIVFFKRHKVQSRSLLGMSSVFTITMSVSMGHGIMFLCGVPFTNMTMMLPFVVYGVGLDDTFIITGIYFRTDPKKDTLERIHETMEEAGLSISLTTITTLVAFALGFASSIPAIQWLCFYAFTCIACDFVFQVTLFVAFVVLDERRLKANRMDVFFWITVKDKVDDDHHHQANSSSSGEREQIEAPNKEQATNGDDGDNNNNNDDEPDAALRFMTWYSEFLMRPFIKALVLAVFVYYLGFCTYRTTLLTQEFIVSDFLPSDSYVSTYLDAVDQYADEMVPLGIYFRGIDQSDPNVQQQMRDYVDDLMSLEQLDTYPPFCWVRDFENSDQYMGDLDLGFDVNLLSFNEKLNLAMTDRRIKEVYGSDIVRDESGNITASRCWVYLRNVDFDVVQSQIDMLNDQRDVTASQSLNEGKSEWSVFTFCDMYFLWEFYSVCVTELTYTTISGVVAVAVVAFLLMPHWTAIFFVLPMICMLYIDLLGTLQMAGLHINAVTYVCLEISIGLLVDFLMHVLLRYYESQAVTREEKVKDTLRTMGVSILVGGLSTFLAVIPLAFSTSAIIGTVFTSFFAIITLGVLHGLIFLPVVLSLFGPTMTPNVHAGNIGATATTAPNPHPAKNNVETHDKEDRSETRRVDESFTYDDQSSFSQHRRALYEV